MERFRDELGDWRLVLHSPFGAQVHAPWALAIAARLRDRYPGMDVQAMHTDDGIVLRVPDADDPPPGGHRRIARPGRGRADSHRRTGRAPRMFASRFRECAARALLLPRRQPGRRTPLWQQRQRSAQLLSVAGKYGTFPIVLETVRECLQDVFDVPGLVTLMRELASRAIRLVEVETPAPSPFGRSLLFRYVGAFMYEGTRRWPSGGPRPSRWTRRCSRNCSARPTCGNCWTQRWCRTPSGNSSGWRATRACRDAEDVADLLRTIGPLSATDVAERCADRRRGRRLAGRPGRATPGP